MKKCMKNTMHMAVAHETKSFLHSAFFCVDDVIANFIPKYISINNKIAI